MNRFSKSLIAAGAFVSLLAVGTLHSTTSAAPAPKPVSLNYFYATSLQNNMNLPSPYTSTVGPESASALMDPEAPTLGTGDFHSLAEMYVGPDLNNGIEIGWIVDATGVNGTDHTQPHLFVGAWKGGNFQGYNSATGSGWVDYSGNADNAGMLLATGTALQFGLQHFNGAWWLAYNHNYIGDFPDTFWGANSFTNLNLVQVFGEVAANSTTPHTQMGKGVLAGSSTGVCPCTGAKISSLTYTGGSAGLTPTLVHQTDANPTKYNSVLLPSNLSMYFGGPGF